MQIKYVTGTDGWGDEPPTATDIATFTALVEHRLSERYPDAEVSAEVDEHAIEPRVTTDSRDIEPRELCTWIGNEVWEAWCSGERAPS